MSFFLDALITSFEFLRETVTFLYIQAQIKAKDKDVRRMTISINCFKENRKSTNNVIIRRIFQLLFNSIQKFFYSYVVRIGFSVSVIIEVEFIAIKISSLLCS